MAHAAGRKALSIRAHLILLALAALVPVLVFAVGVSMLLIAQGGDVIRNATMDRARAMLTAVDAELRGSITALAAIGTSPALQSGDLAAFHGQARRVLASQPNWLNIWLVTPADMRQVMNAAVPFGQPLFAPTVPQAIVNVRDSGRGAVGDVVTGPKLGRPMVPVRVPVLVNGELAYVLNAGVVPASFEKLIRQQNLPEGWVIGIVDGQGRFVARVPSRDAGEPVSVAFRNAMLHATEGWYRGRTVEGLDTYTAHLRSDFSNWTIGLAVPAAYVDEAAQRTGRLLGLGALASMLLALLAAVLIGRRIAGSIDALASAARAIGAERAPGGDGTARVREVAEVAEVLAQSGIAVRERQHLAEREREAMLAADKAKDEFIAMLSHELRNPLSALMTAAQVLRMPGAGPSALENARGVVERQTRLMTRLIEDLLDVNRIVMGKASLVCEPLDLGRLVAEAAAAWRSSGRLDHHQVSVLTVPVPVEADRARMEQVFSNLMQHALKFTPPGKRIEVSVRREGMEAVLEITDEGAGIDAQLGAGIFELFVQGPQTPDRQAGGIGVGLALVKGLVELHGGRVTASSPGLGQGSVLTVRLPLRRVA